MAMNKRVKCKIPRKDAVTPRPVRACVRACVTGDCLGGDERSGPGDLEIHLIRGNKHQTTMSRSDAATF